MPEARDGAASATPSGRPFASVLDELEKPRQVPRAPGGNARDRSPRRRQNEKEASGNGPDDPKATGNKLHDMEMMLNKMISANVEMASTFQQNQLQIQELMKIIASNGSQGNAVNPQVLVDVANTAATAAAQAASAAAAAAPAAAQPNVPAGAQAPPKLKIPKELNIALEKAKTKYETDLRKWTAAKRRNAKLQKELDHFDQAEGCYPPGIKPFSASETMLELDEPNPELIDTDGTVTIKLPQGATSGAQWHQYIGHVFAISNAPN